MDANWRDQALLIQANSGGFTARAKQAWRIQVQHLPGGETSGDAQLAPEDICGNTWGSSAFHKRFQPKRRCVPPRQSTYLVPRAWGRSTLSTVQGTWKSFQSSPKATLRSWLVLFLPRKRPCRGCFLTGVQLPSNVQKTHGQPTFGIPGQRVSSGQDISGFWVRNKLPTAQGY